MLQGEGYQGYVLRMLGLIDHIEQKEGTCQPFIVLPPLSLVAKLNRLEPYQKSSEISGIEALGGFSFSPLEMKWDPDAPQIHEWMKFRKTQIQRQKRRIPPLGPF